MRLGDSFGAQWEKLILHWVPEARHFPTTPAAMRSLKGCLLEANRDKRGLLSAISLSISGTLVVLVLSMLGSVSGYFAGAVGAVLSLIGLCALRRYCSVLSGIMIRRLWDMGICPVCGYSLQGNRSGVCPECGDLVCVSSRGTGMPCSTARSSFMARTLQKRGMPLTCALLLFVVLGIVGYLLSRRITGTGGPWYSVLWAATVAQAILGWGVSVLCFVAGFAVELAHREGLIAPLLSRLVIHVAVNLAIGSIVLFVLALALGCVVF